MKDLSTVGLDEGRVEALKLESGQETYAALQILFSRVLDPAAFYKILYEKDGTLKEMVYIDVNSSYERVMQITREAIVGKSFHEVWSEREEEWRNIIFQVANTGVYARYEGWSHDTGKYLHAVAFSPIRDIVAVIFLDMTDWKQAEKELIEKERLLVEYRSELRRLAARLSLAEARTRRDVAVKLHDRVGYSLAALLNALRAVKEQADGMSDASDVGDKIGQAVSEVEALIQDTRSLTLEISSPLLYEVGLEAALESLADRMLTPCGIVLDFQECGPRTSIEISSRVLVYQMTQELLLNVVKHARAKRVVLRVQRGRKRVRVLVEDDGRGFSVSADQHWGKWSGIGLFSIRERLHSIGGELRILSEKGQGCSVALTAPVSIEREDAANGGAEP